LSAQCHGRPRPVTGVANQPGPNSSTGCYAHSTIELLHDHYKAYDLPIATAALIQGDAVGGGFGALLTNDVVIAERGARFGFPEILFGLFPGMGAYSFLKRRLGERQARMLIEDGKTRTADELHQLGLIDVLCEKGEGEAAVRRYAAEQAPPSRPR
jgi:DSF synthase